MLKLRELPGADGKIGIVGFCFAGRLAFLTAAPIEVDVAVSNYGDGIGNYGREARESRRPRSRFSIGIEIVPVPQIPIGAASERGEGDSGSGKYNRARERYDSVVTALRLSHMRRTYLSIRVDW